MFAHVILDKKDGKTKYGFFSNMLYMIKCIREWNPVLFVLIFVTFIPRMAASLLSTLLPSNLVSHLENRSSPLVLVSSMAGMVLLMFLCSTLAMSILSDFEEKCDAFGNYFGAKYVRKIVKMDFAALDVEEFKALSNSAWKLSRYGGGVSYVADVFPYLVIDFSGTVIYGAVLARRSVLLVVIILGSIALDMRLLVMARRQHQKLMANISKDARQAEYLTASVNTAAAGKDIRIYRMLDWILKKYDGLLADLEKSYRRIHNWYLLRNGTAALFNLVKNSVAYYLLLVMLAKGKMTPAEFVFYVGAINQFENFVEMTFRNVQLLNSQSAGISDMREFLEAKENLFFSGELSEEKMEEIRKSPVVLEFRDVTFSYHEKGREILSHVSFTVQKGEKLALLGLNGAGKTTLVKLLCGFYQPDAGEILINGISIYRFDREKYLKCISVLFQDTVFLPLSIDQNISGLADEEKIDKEKMHRVLKLSGFLDKYESLPEKGRTKLVKELNEKSVDFSGGERQKMMFARALYKEAPVVVLDEPTAALDPIAENELYLHYGEAMQGKMGIFISHRLSSTRFCDRILLLEDGKIIEEGTHKSLMDLGGRYAELYEMQSHYYKEQGEAV